MRAWLQPEPQSWTQAVDAALAEDIGPGDVSAFGLPESGVADWYIEAQAEGIVCGMGIVQHLLGGNGDSVEIKFRDGSRVSPGTIVAKGRADLRRALSVERTALNFLMPLSGVATLTSEFVKQVEGTGARIVDTRKTIPNLRALQKYAVRCGGGHNHRMGLYDGAMLKDNHIKAAGSITNAIRKLREWAPHMVRIEVECETLVQVDEAVAAGAHVVLLDNMDCVDMSEAVRRHAGKCLFEASGGVSLATVRLIAETGVDLISVGAITHSAPALPFHMELE